MANFNNVTITSKGLALLTKATAGQCNIAFTKMCTSDAAVTSQTATSLSSIKQTSVVASIAVVNDTNVKVSTAFDNTSLTTGYYVNTIGLYAMDQDEGEILYCYATADTADYMPPFNGIGTSSLLVDIVTAVSGTDNVDLTVTPAAYATVAQITDLQKELNDVKGYVGYGYENVWGVEVDYKNNKITRLAAAEGLQGGTDFDNFKPWQRRKCLVSESGEVLCYLGDEGYTETGLCNGIDATTLNVMVEQPIFYTKVVPLFYEDAASGVGKQLCKVRYYISDTPLEGFAANEVFKDANGNWQDKIYLAAYEGALRNNDSQICAVSDNVTDLDWSNLYYQLASSNGVKPVSGLNLSLNLTNARKLADAINNDETSGWCLHNIFALSATQLLMLVEYATFDCQTAIGKGVCSIADDGSSNMATSTGATYSLVNLGNASGNTSGISEDDGTFSVAYRGEENLWGNIVTWLDGINVEAKNLNNIYVNSNMTNMADNTTDNYSKISYQMARKTGYINAFGYDNKYPYLFLSTACDGTSTGLVRAGLWQAYTADRINAAALGGYWSANNCSVWRLNADIAASFRHRTYGCRLLYIPQS